jgi:dTMP kinase
VRYIYVSKEVLVVDRQRGKYIVLEGPDFSGKDTQAKLLMNRLQQLGREAIFIREPGTGTVGGRIREILLRRNESGEDPLTIESELLLFMANRAQIREHVIEPNLVEGKIVLSSRDRLSSRAYQGYGRGISVDLIESIGRFSMRELCPDLYLIFMLPIEVLFERMAVAKELDRIEQEKRGFYERVLKGYEDFIRDNPQMVAVFDATQSIQEIHGQVTSRVEQLLG